MTTWRARSPRWEPIRRSTPLACKELATRRQSLTVPRESEKDRTPLPLMTEMTRIEIQAWRRAEDKLVHAVRQLRVCDLAVMPFGWANSPPHFKPLWRKERSMDGWIGIIYGEHPNLRTRHAGGAPGVRPSPATTSRFQKCAWAASEMPFPEFCGGGIGMKPSRVEAISEGPAPGTLRELQVFLESRISRRRMAPNR